MPQLADATALMQDLYSTRNATSMARLSANLLATFFSTGAFDFPQQVYNKDQRSKLSRELSHHIRDAVTENGMTQSDLDSSDSDACRLTNGTTLLKKGSNRSIPGFCFRSCMLWKKHWGHSLRGGFDEGERITTPEPSISQTENEAVATLQRSNFPCVSTSREVLHMRHGEQSQQNPQALVSQVLAEMRSRLDDLDGEKSALHDDDSGKDEMDDEEEKPLASGESSAEAWGPGLGQMEACVTDEWDEIYPEDAQRWKRTTYYDDVIPPAGYENEYVHANQSWKKYPSHVQASIRALNAEFGLNMSLEPAPNTWDPDLYRPSFLFRPLKQIAREMQEEHYLAREQRGLVPLRNRTRERLGRELVKLCQLFSKIEGRETRNTASIADEEEKALEILRNGADVNQTDHLDRTALHLCCDGDAPERLVVALIQAGASVGARDRLGRTALHAAAEFRGSARPRSAAVVRALLAHGADAAALSKKGRTCTAVAEDALYYTEVHAGRKSEEAAAARQVVGLLGGDESAGLRRWIETTHRTARRQQEKRNAADGSGLDGVEERVSHYVPASIWADDSDSEEMAASATAA
jgi:hypothetical protein